MEFLLNPWAGQCLYPDIPMPSTDADAPFALLKDCPQHAETPLVEIPGFAGAGRCFVKDERGRMGLGSFKALGAAYVIAHAAQNGGVEGRTFVTASAGNHGMSVAAGAKVFGADAVIYLSETVPESFADRLREKGAKVVVEGADYEASMAAALKAAEDNGWTLLSDSSWKGYTELPHRLMEGYLAMAAEAADQMPVPPTHIFLQAGVGGLAGACAAYFRKKWGAAPIIVVVEPEAAPALYGSIQAGEFVAATGPVSEMGRLDCKEPSLIALNGLASDANVFTLISEEEAQAVLPMLADQGLETSASGGAGLAGVLAGGSTLGVGEQSVVLTILSEGPA